MAKDDGLDAIHETSLPLPDLEIQDIEGIGSTTAKKLKEAGSLVQAHALAYNLGNFLRTLATPEAMQDCSLASLREKLIKTGAKVVSHGRFVAFQMAEVAIPRKLFELIADLGSPGMRGDMNRAVRAMAQTVGAVRPEERGSTVLAPRSRPTLFLGSKRAGPRSPAWRPGLEKAHFVSNHQVIRRIPVWCLRDCRSYFGHTLWFRR